MRLEGKVAAVTGAAKGIGLAIAERFVAEGAKVVLNDVDVDALKEAADRLGMPYEVGDVGLKASADQLIARTVNEFGRIDIMVSNAGVTNTPAEFVDLPEEEFDRVLRINLKSQFLTGQAAARQMIAQGDGGVIINMSSVNSRLAIPTMTPYAVSKAGSTQLTNVMAISLGGHGIRVNAIGPGTILTQLGRKAVLGDEAARVRALSRTPMRRFGTPEEVAGVAVFLATNDSSYITGQTIYPDGGRMGLNYTVPVD
jgi:NAD(P)-dependent dehydrogenase (short-subunit alcohol dehydrogenase family)